MQAAEWDGEAEGREIHSRGAGSGGQALGQWLGGLEMSEHSRIRDYFLSVTWCLGVLRMTASDGSSLRDCLLSGNGKESPTSVQKRVNPGETGTEAVFSPLAFPDFSDAVRKGRVTGTPSSGSRRGKREELPPSLPPASECRTGSVPASVAVRELCSDHVRP